MVVSIDNFTTKELLSRKNYDDVGVVGLPPSEKLKILSCNKEIVDSLQFSSLRWRRRNIENAVYVDVEDNCLFYIKRILFRFKFVSGMSWSLEISLPDTYAYKMLLDMLSRGVSILPCLYNYTRCWRDIFSAVVENNLNLAVNKNNLLGGL